MYSEKVYFRRQMHFDTKRSNNRKQWLEPFKPWPNGLASRRKSTQVGGQTKRKLNASPKPASTCESVWPGLYTRIWYEDLLEAWKSVLKPKNPLNPASAKSEFHHELRGAPFLYAYNYVGNFIRIDCFNKCLEIQSTKTCQ